MPRCGVKVWGTRDSPQEQTGHPERAVSAARGFGLSMGGALSSTQTPLLVGPSLLPPPLSLTHPELRSCGFSHTPACPTQTPAAPAVPSDVHIGSGCPSPRPSASWLPCCSLQSPGASHWPGGFPRATLSYSGIKEEIQCEHFTHVVMAKCGDSGGRQRCPECPTGRGSSVSPGKAFPTP